MSADKVRSGGSGPNVDMNQLQLVLGGRDNSKGPEWRSDLSGRSIHSTCDQSVTDVGNPLLLVCCKPASFSREMARASTAGTASMAMPMACLSKAKAKGVRTWARQGGM